MYLALPAGDDPMIIHGAIPAGSSVLELGSGPGRVTRVLIALGHTVVAVDDSDKMLAHVTGAETVCADVFDLDLGRRFDVVVAASTLINQPRRERRRSLLDVCARHVNANGSVLIERYRPGWLATAGVATGTSGPVEMTFTPLSRSGAVVRASMTYRLGASSWEQRFEATDVNDEILVEDAAAAKLTVAGSLTDDETWVRLRSSE